MGDERRILVFSDAAGTVRPYNADRPAKNQRLRVRFLIEPRWKTDAAIGGECPSRETHRCLGLACKPGQLRG